MKAADIVNRLLEAGPDDVSAKDYLQAVPAWRQEVWCFSSAELRTPKRCNGNDQLVASFSTDPNDEDQSNDEAIVHVVVLRNGTPTDRYACYGQSVEANRRDARVPREWMDRANEEISLFSPIADDIADEWRDVVANVDGSFVRWGKL